MKNLSYFYKQVTQVTLFSHLLKDGHVSCPRVEKNWEVQKYFLLPEAYLFNLWSKTAFIVTKNITFSFFLLLKIK